MDVPHSFIGALEFTPTVRIMELKSPCLNHDVLDYIAAHSTRATVLTLMRTCKALHRDGAKYVLEDLESIDIDLEKPEESVLSFLLFMAVEQGRRWHFVRALRIVSEDAPSLPPNVAGQLADALRHATRLKSLVLHQAEGFLRLHDDIAPALASLKTIEVLEATYLWRRTFTLIKTASWPLRTVDIAFDHDDEDGELPEPEELNRAALFCGASSTLTEVAYRGWECYGEWLPSYPVFPNVRQLTVFGDHDAPTASWAQAYPNLTCLHTCTPVVCGGGRMSDDDHRVEMTDSVHAFNRRFNGRPGETFWSTLDEYYCCCLADLYVLALPSRIRRIEMWQIDAWEMCFLSYTMSVARPEELYINNLPLRDLPHYLKLATKPGENILADLRLLDITVTGEPEDVMSGLPGALVRPVPFPRCR